MSVRSSSSTAASSRSATKGRGVLLVSLELEEILSLADRILVMYEGEIVGEFPPTVTEEQLGIAMTGGGRAGGARRERGAGRRLPASTRPGSVPRSGRR